MTFYINITDLLMDETIDKVLHMYNIKSLVLEKFIFIFADGADLQYFNLSSP